MRQILRWQMDPQPLDQALLALDEESPRFLGHDWAAPLN